MKSKNDPALAARRLSAQQRAAEAAKRTPEQQIARLDKILDKMFGVGLGATKERAKLAKRIANRKA